MKKQTILILLAITVITALITVSAFSNEEGYKVSLCDAIVISVENATVTDFLNATNITTVQLYNCLISKATKGKTPGGFNGLSQTGLWMYILMWQQGI